jgi:TonB-linked SusC/RagA family outer membrane protein
MKCFLIITICSFLHVSAATPLQAQITINVKNATLKDVMREIKRQSHYTFLFSDEILKDARPVSVSLKNAGIEKVLEECFADQPFGYVLKGETILITRKEGEKEAADPQQQTNGINGMILDENDNPLTGASVIVKGTKTGTTTNNEGKFALRRVDEKSIVEVSFIGFETQELDLSKNWETITRGFNSFRISLKRREGQLDEIQVIAYSKTTTRLQTGNVSSIKGAEINKQPVSNPLLALEGQIPGLFITQASGVPGAGVNVQIQGQNSIRNGNDPFYVIDGVPFISQLLPNIGSASFLFGSTGSSGSPFNFINPADIESISVLKDADATAIYGSRAANGAILITTRKGKAGNITTNINMQTGWGKVVNKMNLLNTRQYLQMRHEALSNDGNMPGATDYDINGTWDTTRYTDWQKELIGKTAQYTTGSASISGGSTSTQYIVGATYHRETTVFPGDLSDHKASLHFNINSASANNKLRLQFSGNYLNDNNRIIGRDLTQTALQTPPDAPTLYKADGSVNWAPDALGNSTWPNPVAYLDNKYKIKTSNLLGNLLLSYQILPGLEIKSSFGYTNLQSNEVYLAPLTATAPDRRPYTQRYARFVNNNINSWLIEPQASYNRNIGNGILDVLIGGTLQQNNSNGLQMFGYGYNNDLVLEDIKSAPNVLILSTTNSIYKYNAAFGRLNYNWNGKYLGSINIRRDGSSRFGSENLFHNFASVAGAWIFSNEEFLKKNIHVISFGKLRASYGTTGNDQIGDYQFLSLYAPPLYGVTIPYQGTKALVPSRLPNPFLQWEETRKLNLGIDIGFIDDRILLNANYTNNRSSNQILAYSLPIITGFQSISKNFPATVQNTGWEFSLNTINIKQKKFRWTSNLNLTIPRNKLLAFPNLAASSYASTLDVGKPITEIKLFHYLGVDPATGLFQFSDINGHPTSTPDNIKDLSASINPAPKFYGGFKNSFSLNGFELDIFLQFVKQVAPNYMFGSAIPGAYVPGSTGNQPASVLDRWRKPGDIASQQRYNSDFSLSTQYYDAISSNGGWSNASYIRVKNVSLSWEIPEKWRKKSYLQNCRLYVQGQNLFTITNYTGMDPENYSITSLPPLRVITIGAQVTL